MEKKMKVENKKWKRLDKSKTLRNAKQRMSFSFINLSIFYETWEYKSSIRGIERKEEGCVATLNVKSTAKKRETD